MPQNDRIAAIVASSTAFPHKTKPKLELQHTWCRALVSRRRIVVQSGCREGGESRVGR